MFEHTGTKSLTEVKFDALHIVPPQIPPKFIKDSGLSDAAGYTDINPSTL